MFAGELNCGPHPRRRAVYLAMWNSAAHAAPFITLLGDMCFYKGGALVSKLELNATLSLVAGLTTITRDANRPPGWRSPFRAVPQSGAFDGEVAGDALAWTPASSYGSMTLLLSPHYTDFDFDSVKIINRPSLFCVVCDATMGSIFLAVKDI